MCAQLFYFFQLANRKKFTKDVILRKPRKVQWILLQYDFERRLKKSGQLKYPVHKKFFML